MSIPLNQTFNFHKENICFLFTKKYPYGKNETYVHYELDYLLNRFSKVVIVPIEEYEYAESRVQENERLEIFRVNQNIPRLHFVEKMASRIKNHLLLLQIFFHSREKLKTLLSWKKYATRLVHLRGQSLAIGHFFDEKSKRAEVVFYHYWLHNSVVAQRLAAIKPSRTVARAHALDLYHKDWPSENKSSFLQFERIKIKTCDLIFSISQHGMDHFNRTFPSFSHKFVLNRLGIEDKNPLFTPKSMMPDKESGCYLIVTCSNLTPRKRLHLMPLILRHVRTKIKWIHIGGSDGEEIVSLSKDCFQYGIAFEFKAQLPSDEIIGFYRERPVALFCNLSYAEGIPVSLMEAAMFGIPLMATDTFGNPEIVGSDNGFLIPVDFNPEMVALQVDQLLNNPSGWSDMSMESRNIYLNRFHSSKNMNEFVSSLNID